MAARVTGVHVHAPLCVLEARRKTRRPLRRAVCLLARGPRTQELHLLAEELDLALAVRPLRCAGSLPLSAFEVGKEQRAERD
jgi:hypothetical protein